MCHVELNKKCDFVIFYFFSTFWNLIHIGIQKISLNFRKLLILSIFIFCFVNWTYVPRRIKTYGFIDPFKFSSSFWNPIHFWPRKFFLNLRKLLILSIFIFCLVNWTYVIRRIEQKVGFCRYF